MAEKKSSTTAKKETSKKATASKDGRARNFATVVYPESAPNDWQGLRADQFVPALISPLHDSDKNPTGEDKKPHYHVLIMFEGKKSKEQAEALIQLFGGVGCETVNSIRGYARYLCHLDNPEKTQYNPEDVRSLCGADYNGICSLVIDKYKAIREMMQYCAENNVLSYAELLEYCAYEKFEWFRVLCDNGTMVMREYLKSKSWTNDQKNKNQE